MRLTFWLTGDVIEYTEFKLGVTTWSLETTDDEPCDELVEICRLIHADELAVSPAEIRPRPEPLLLTSKSDPEMFLSINFADDPTNQMEVVGLSVRCKDEFADAIHERLKSIRQRSAVKTALLRGNLGLPSS